MAGRPACLRIHASRATQGPVRHQPPRAAAALAKGRRVIEQGWSPRLGSFTSHGRARPTWDAADFERETELAILDVDHEPGCPRPRPLVRDLGPRVDGRTAAVLECAHCGGSLPLVDRSPSESAPTTPELTRPAAGRAGRPAWSKELFHRRYDEAVDATEAPRTPARVADHLRRLDGSRGIEPESLARLLRRFGRPNSDSR